LVHNLKSCKDSRRSFLFWEPYCIATSWGTPQQSQKFTTTISN
jgi:hypothetical protein